MKKKSNKHSRGGRSKGTLTQNLARGDWHYIKQKGPRQCAESLVLEFRGESRVRKV